MALPECGVDRRAAQWRRKRWDTDLIGDSLKQLSSNTTTPVPIKFPQDRRNRLAIRMETRTLVFKKLFVFCSRFTSKDILTLNIAVPVSHFLASWGGAARTTAPTIKP